MEDSGKNIPITPKLSGPKRQHFIPRFYLEGFCQNGLLSLYDRVENAYRDQTPLNTTTIGHYYTFTDQEGRRRFDLEYLMSDYEGKAAPILKKLSQREEISDEERSDMSIFIAMLGFRIPDQIDSLKSANGEMIKKISRMMFGNLDQAKKIIRENPENIKLTEEEIENQAKIMANFIEDGNYTVETDHQWIMGMSINMFLQVAPIFSQRDWVILHSTSDKKSFVTSDSPLTLTTIQPRQNDFWGIGYANSDALVIFPLSKSCVLVMYGSDGNLSHGSISNKEIREVNCLTADRCQRFLMGQDEALIRSLVSHTGIDNKKWGSKIKVS